MTKEEFLKIQTCVLKVNIHCDGCRQKVKKLLQKIEGVYTVNIDAEQQKVTVSGNVDSAILIKKLLRAGKHAEPWSQKSVQNQKSQQSHCIKNGNNAKDQKQGHKAFKNQQSIPSFSYEDDEYCGEGEEDDEEEELRFFRERANHMLRQANEANAKKAAAAAAANSNKGGNGGGNGKKGGGNHGGNPNQNVGMKNAGGSDQKNTNPAPNKMNNHPLLGVGGIGSAGGGEGRRININDLNAMGLGFHGHGAAGMGIGGNGLAFPQPNSTFQGSGLPTGGLGGGLHHQSPMSMNMQGYQYHPSAMLMNMQNKPNMMPDNRYQQPQMMYHRSPAMHPYTGYYQYDSYPSYQSESVDYTAQTFNDENTSSCAIM